MASVCTLALGLANAGEACQIHACKGFAFSASRLSIKGHIHHYGIPFNCVPDQGIHFIVREIDPKLSTASYYINPLPAG